MTREVLKKIAMLRVSVGFLGESHQNNWWPGAFFSPSSEAFLAPVFGKTSFLARYYGVKEAAAIAHDKRIGVGEGVFHLFRLPEALERDLRALLDDPEMEKEAREITGDKESAFRFLRESAEKGKGLEEGPVRLGDRSELLDETIWRIAARHYLTAFQKGGRTLPFFSRGS
ncbi:MAG: BrxE family protein [Desulfobacterales bacterium]|nr:BrxE family protein [Desulfobacterales bacterium]